MLICTILTTSQGNVAVVEKTNKGYKSQQQSFSPLFKVYGTPNSRLGYRSYPELLSGKYYYCTEGVHVKFLIIPKAALVC